MTSPGVSRYWGEQARELLLRPETASIAGALLVFATFSILSPLFLTVATAVSVTSVASELGIVSIGMTVLLICGHFDLSVGAILGLASYFVVFLIRDMGFEPISAFAGAILIAACLGSVNGVVQVKTQIHSFIVTLGTALVYRGMLVGLTGGLSQSVEIPQILKDIVAGPILPFGLRMSFLWFALVVAGVTFLLTRMRLGNWMQAIGQNARAAHNLGVNVARTTIIAFMLSGALAGMVGVIQAVRFSSVDASRGLLIELQAVAVSVIGGTLLSGGYGSAVGTMMGAFVLGMIQTGLVLVSAPGFLYTTITGVIVVAAVVVNNWFARIVASFAPVEGAEEDDEIKAPRAQPAGDGAAR